MDGRGAARRYAAGGVATRCVAGRSVAFGALALLLVPAASAQTPDDTDEFPASLALPAPVRAEPGAGFSYPADEPGLQLGRGVASWYGQPFHGRRTASGERFDMHAFTAASNRLPFGTQVRVTDVNTGRSVIVRVNDRLHDANPRAIDLSWAAANSLGIVSAGLAELTVEVLGAAAPGVAAEPGGR
jgi:rare lipoprotein A